MMYLYANRKYARLIGVVLLSLVGCSQPTPPVVSTKPDHDAIAAIRSAGSQSDSAVEVQPLRDPAVDGLVNQAHELEAQNKFDDAVAIARQALALANDAPDLLQLLSELEFERRNYQDAATLAQKSFELGPKIGSLCARNWQTMIEVRKILKDDGGVEQAKRELNNCQASRPVRM